MDVEGLPAALPCAAPASQLLSLPSVLLSEVLSWSSDSASANALLNTCAALHALRLDPASAALLLLRYRSKDYDAALASCAAACAGGTAAVVQQILRQLVGGPHASAPPGLLQALLFASAELGDATSLRVLLALPQPPDMDGVDSQALKAALKGGHRLEALRLLLEVGALTRSIASGWGRWALSLTAKTAAGAAVLPLLVQYWPPFDPEGPAPSLQSCLLEAFRGAVPEVVPTLLSAMDAAAGVAAGADAARAAKLLLGATARGCPSVLAAVLGHAPASADALAAALAYGVNLHQAACVRLLLHHGAVVGAAGEGLLACAMAPQWCRVLLSSQMRAVMDAAHCETMGLLLESGAIATPALLAKAAQADCAGLVPLLQLAIARAAGAVPTPPVESATAAAEHLLASSPAGNA